MCNFYIDDRGVKRLNKCTRGQLMWKAYQRRPDIPPRKSLHYWWWVGHMKAIGHTNANNPHEYLTPNTPKRRKG